MKIEQASKWLTYSINFKTGEYYYPIDYNSNLKWLLICPYCKNEVSFKKGHIINSNGIKRKSHFFHLNSECTENKVSSLWESELHKKWKDIVENIIREIISSREDFNVIKLQKEYELKNWDIHRIADLYLEYSYNWQNYKRVFEIQYSNVSEEDLKQRHEDYKQMWINDTWIIGYLLSDKEWEVKNDNIKLLDYIWNYVINSKYKKSNFGSDVNNHNWLRNYVTIPQDNYKKIKKKVLSLSEKISQFQDNILLIDNNNLKIFSNLKVDFIWNLLYWNEHKQLLLENQEKIFNDIKYTVCFQKTSWKIKYINDYEVVNIWLNDIWINFIIDGNLTIFNKNKYEEQYNCSQLSKYKDILFKIVKERNEEIIEYNKTLTDIKFWEEKFYYLLLELILSFQNEITLYKNNWYAKHNYSQLNDMMINYNKDKLKVWNYWFFSWFNNSYIWMIKRWLSRINWPNSIIKALNNMIDFLEKIEYNIHLKISYDRFNSYFTKMKPRIDDIDWFYEIIDEWDIAFCNAWLEEDIRFWIYEIVKRLSFKLFKNDKLKFIYNSLINNSVEVCIKNLKKEKDILENIWRKSWNIAGSNKKQLFFWTAPTKV